MPAFRLRQKKAKHVAVVDVGSASAAVGIVNIDTKGLSTVLSAHRAFIPYEKRSIEQFAARMSSSIAEAAGKAMQAYSVRKDRLPAVTEAYVFFRAPWTEAEVSKLTSTFPESTRITRDDMEQITKQATAEKGKVLEAIVLRTEVNGYQTDNPVGKSGTMLSLFALVSSVNEVLQNATMESLQKSLPQAEPKWRSHMRAILTVVREHAVRSKNCVVIDISSEGSSLLSIRDGILDQQVAFDLGIHSILERLSQAALPEETLGMIRMIERDQCSGQGCAQLKSAMEKLETELVREFGEKLAELSAHGKLAQDLLLFVHPDVSPWLARFFSRIDFSQFTLTLQPFAVAELSPKDLQEWVQTESSTADTSLMLSAALVHIEAQVGR